MTATAKETRNRSFIGGGTVYIREKGKDTGFEEIGNSDTLQFAIAENKITQRNFKQKGGGNIASASSVTDVTGSLNGLSMQPNALAIALRSLVTTTAGAAQSSEAHPAYKNSLVRLKHIPDLDQTITVTGTGGTPTYVEGTDYEVRPGGIFIIEAGSIPSTTASANNLEVSYTSITSFSIQGVTRSAVDYELYFDGFNDADNGKSVQVMCHKVTFSPSQALDLISEEYGQLPMSFELLADETVVGAGESKYFEVKMAE